jgi:CBS domain-containing protein
MRTVESTLAKVPVAAAMVTRYHVLAPTDPARRAIELSLLGFQADFPVVEDGRPVGLVSRSDVLWVAAANRPEVPVSTIMRTELGVVRPTDTMAVALRRTREAGSPVLVVEAGNLVGMLTDHALVEACAGGAR